MIRSILVSINTILITIAIVAVLRSRKPPESALAWILALIALPGVGLVAYILVGIDWRGRNLVKRVPEDLFAGRLAPLLDEQKGFLEEMVLSEDPRFRRAARNILLVAKASSTVITDGNSIQSYFDGQEKFDSMMADMQNARKSIHMEYYIWRSDTLGEKIRELLEKKAAEGVDIRLLFDGLGSYGRISYAYRRALTAAGIQFAYFLDLGNPVARLKINYRNHRKITVIDGHIAYTGGMNLGQEYIDGGRAFNGWRDTHLRIEGPAVSLLQGIFLVDWQNSGRSLPHNNEIVELMHLGPGDVSQGHGLPVQIVASGPDSRWDAIRLHYLELINSAREEILIQSPYYIPGQAVEQALIAAALRGVRVLLMTVGIPDQKLPFWAAQTYFAPLLEAGVEVYRYQAGFLHSKVVIQDRFIASVGTCNMDVRSFALDYEVNAVVHDETFASAHADRILADLEDCRPLTASDLADVSLLERLRNSLARLLSPLL